MTAMRAILIFLVLIVTLTACEKTVVLDFDQTDMKLVIEGWVTDAPGQQYVKVSRTTGFYTTGKTPRVTDATVEVRDDMGNTHMFIHNPNNRPDSAGYYLPATPFVGQTGHTYSLTVVVDGQTYEAKDKLNPTVSIDRLETRVDEDEREDPKDPGRFYEVLIFAREPQETRDYYLFKFYRNGELAFDSESDVYFADDELIGEEIDGISGAAYYEVNDVARIESYSLSREAFIFYRDLQKVLNNDGGMFNPPAADPRSNLSNGALGFFVTGAVVSAEITVTE